MLLWKTNLVKMKFNKLLFSSSVLLKLQSPFVVRKTFINRTQLQNFSLSSCFFSERNEGSVSSVLFTGMEQITSLGRISKKKNKLSKVEEKDFETLERLKKGDNTDIDETDLDIFKDYIKSNVKYASGKAFQYVTKLEPEGFIPKTFDTYSDILIIGGGAVGLSIAYSIRNQFPHGPKVTVVDKDSSHPHLSTNLGQGLTSLQMFNEKEEIPILKYGTEFFSAFTRNTEILDNYKFKLDYDPLGSLLLVDESNVEQVLRNHEILETFGVHNLMLEKETLEKMFPWLHTKNILFGSLGMYGEGVVDPWTYIYGLKSKCISLGVTFVTAEIIDFGFERNNIRRAICKFPNGSYNFIDFSYCVLAGGLESLNLVNLLNESKYFSFSLRLPIEERMRYEYCFYSSNGPGLNTPIIFNPDGTYFRREGLTGHYVTGVPSVVPNDDDEGDYDEESAPFQVLEDVIKPFLIERIPNLKRIDLVKGWIDAYDYCIANKVGITGPHPSTNKVVFALGFSHLGLQYLPALGRAVMEYIIYDSYQTIDFEPFHVENLWRKQHLEADKKRQELLEAQQRVPLSEK